MEKKSGPRSVVCLGGGSGEVPSLGSMVFGSECVGFRAKGSLGRGIQGDCNGESHMSFCLNSLKGVIQGVI